MTNNPGTRGQSRADESEAAQRFTSSGDIAEIREFGTGNINDTFLVSTSAPAARKFILQRLNTTVFPEPVLVMKNIRTVTDHIRKEVDQFPATGRRWETLEILTTSDQADYWIDPAGSFWRATSFIDGTESSDIVRNIEHAREVGFALGMFHSLLSNLPCEKLGDTLEGFHVTPVYLERYDRICFGKPPPLSARVRFCMDFIERRRGIVGVLEEARAVGKLHSRPVHGDPKVNNILMDKVTGLAVAVVDLDTVKPGLIHHDIGDCLRSCCNPLGEETEDWESVQFEPDLCRAILKGYFSVARGFITEEDVRYMFDAIRLISFELGLRFFTDYLAGNLYFKVGYGEQNLARALVQFKLAESIEYLEIPVRAIIRETGKTA